MAASGSNLLEHRAPSQIDAYCLSGVERQTGRLNEWGEFQKLESSDWV